LKTCRSNFEYAVWKTLQNHLSPNETLEYEKTKLKYTSEHEYLVDFTITRKDGSVFYIESKGYFDSADRAKHLAIRKAHPGLDIRFVFMTNNLIHPKSKTRYTDWATTHGFKSALKEIPPDWLES